MHFSRFLVEGDEKLLFLLDVDGEAEQHIERLVEKAGPVFDAIFTHVDNPPATPVADNPESVTRWLKRHVREPLDTYLLTGTLRFRTSRHARVRRALPAIPRRAPCLTYMSFKSRVQSFAVKLVAGALIGDKGHKASDSIGTLHVAHWVVL